jgi:alginate O-acetyltransferase complex protein AlgI
MLFNSVDFLVFFPAVTVLYFALPPRARWALLLAASCAFYMAFVPAYILILAFTIVVDYGAALMIERETGRRRRALLVASLVANLGVLALFKYLGFAAANLNGLARFLGWNYSLPALEIFLPLGLSFHTFQAMSYTIEVYRGHQRAERHFGIYALYVMFYPQLVAGPIERPQNLLPQFREHHVPDPHRIAAGLRLMAWGMFKKVVIADRVAPYVNVVYDAPTSYEGPALALATILFAVQIYCDFSGYSDIALGSARVMGFRLMDNFRHPYAARSVSEFWRRWHISLSTWFRDYVYVPLGGGRVSAARRAGNIAVVFVLSGLWHGASWTFVAWGAIHAGLLIASLATASVRARAVRRVGLDRMPRTHRAVQTAITFCLVTAAWVFFRAESLSDAVYIVTHLLPLSGASQLVILGGGGAPLAVKTVAAAAALGLLFTVEWGRLHAAPRAYFLGRPLWVRSLAYAGIALAVMNLGTTQKVPFIYFQF